MAYTDMIGLGSETTSGVNRGLSSDTISKLKEADESAIVSPIDTNIEDNTAKQEALTSIVEKMENLQTYVESLNGDTLFLERSASVSSEGIGISIDKGVTVQDLSIEVSQLAKKDVIQSDAFSSLTESISSEDSDITFTINGSDYTFDVTSSTTLSDLRDSINDDSSIPVTAKIIKTGESEYRLTLTSDETGESYKIETTEGDGLLTNLSSEDNHVQTAQDAEFTYNGTPISRSSNSVDDLVVGVTLELTQITDQPINISIDIDSTAIMTEVQNFVDAYNELVVLLAEMTKFDEESDTTGVFQGNNNITSINQTIKRKLLSIDSENRSLVEFGITLSQTGQMEFDIKTFSEKLEEAPVVIEDFFKGSEVEDRGVTTHKDGLFYQLESVMENYLSSEGFLNYYSSSLDREEERLNEEREKAVELLNNRYDRMATQFIEADALISQWTQQFNSVQMLIDYDTAKN
jgi:flagellar hook-associated protein 2